MVKFAMEFGMNGVNSLMNRNRFGPFFQPKKLHMEPQNMEDVTR